MFIDVDATLHSHTCFKMVSSERICLAISAFSWSMNGDIAMTAAKDGIVSAKSRWKGGAENNQQQGEAKNWPEVQSPHPRLAQEPGGTPADKEHHVVENKTHGPASLREPARSQILICLTVAFDVVCDPVDHGSHDNEECYHHDREEGHDANVAHVEGNCCKTVRKRKVAMTGTHTFEPNLKKESTQLRTFILRYNQKGKSCPTDSSVSRRASTKTTSFAAERMKKALISS